MGDGEKAVFKVHIRGSIEAVWRELTKTDDVQKAMFNCRMHTTGLKPGGKMQMRTPNGKYTAVVGEILEFDPPRRFSHTMRFTQYDDPPATVTYVLVEKDDGVEFTLTVTNITPGTKSARSMAQGGRMIVNTLKAIVETGTPPLGIRLLYVLFKLMAPMTPKKCLSRNWPMQ